MEIKWITHQTKEILYTDYRGCQNAAEMIQLLHQQVEILRRQIQLEQKTLLLVNYTGSPPSKAFTNEIKKFVEEAEKKDVDLSKMFKTANVGIGGIGKILYNAYMAITKQKENVIFSTETEAIDWLVS